MSEVMLKRRKKPKRYTTPEGEEVIEGTPEQIAYAIKDFVQQRKSVVKEILEQRKRGRMGYIRELVKLIWQEIKEAYYSMMRGIQKRETRKR
ncbi:hypothetical protein [Candidatus Methanodesulfokora washburnensis]|uniref:Uncharacterized protein n=1 Tax=Candidatus Methanodesulfokora washburnensis TaxID=2478471 RepID=A0A520KKD4_9CREN|nr:hypothetical protein [Candidatus Methanodesulfokores washburnensis]RZN60748.1 MAG: hypothetical protein EF810_05495 [Candidatus Methanodesulfokores washburnensis]